MALLDTEFNCTEIERWEDVLNSNADTLIILQPEMLFPKVSFEIMKGHGYNIRVRD